MNLVPKSLAIAALAFCSVSLLAQNQPLHKLNASTSDELAAEQAQIVNLSANRALTDAGRDIAESAIKINSSTSGRHHGGNPHPTLFPADLSNQGGAVVPNAELENIFINDAPSAWGNPLGFEKDLNRSDLIHVTDQYVSAHADGRYPVGTNFQAALAPGAAFTGKAPNIITQAQIVGLVHAAASLLGAGGYDHIFNVFIPPGVDTCFPGNRSCFSPDNLPTFGFCAYHGSVTFSDIGHVLFVVAPETGVPGCASQQPSVNGIVADSTDSTLSHEIIETVTDPDGNAWFVTGSLDLGGFEIGDVCQPGGNDQAEFLVPTFRVNNHLYAIQLEYSNIGHGCFSRPQGGGD